MATRRHENKRFLQETVQQQEPVVIETPVEIVRTTSCTTRSSW